MTSYQINALYKFVPLPHYQDMQQPLLALCKAHAVKGTVLLAEEGINGTIAGPPASMCLVLEYLRSFPALQQLETKESYSETNPFLRMRVRLKTEIVTMGVPGTDPTKTVGSYVEPKEWNALISRPDVMVIDTRNLYETEIGSFEGAILPDIDTFREFPAWMEESEKKNQDNKPAVAMFCTGGIRCEKATSYLLAQGYTEVFHLKGGILKYLEEIPKSQSMWHGECFVFDNRVSVNHELEQGTYDMCHGCRCPISEADKQSPEYQRGVCCPRCHRELTEQQKSRFREREHQIQLAAKRETTHIGPRD